MSQGAPDLQEQPRVRLIAPAAKAPSKPAKRGAGPRGIRPKGRQSYRFIRAYTTTFVVLGSYLWFFFLGRWFGQAWLDARMADVHGRNARRVLSTIVELQGLFIKVGQLLSIMANFLPAQFRSGLEALQDQVPPRPYREIAERIEREFGKPVGAIFDRFCEEPIASASLGQVHEAWLKNGVHVAVKVQHRDIDEIVRLDLTTIRRIMQIVSIFVPVQGLDAYYHQVRSMILEELDFQSEARNITRIADNFLRDPTVRFPRPVDGYCTSRVMTTDFVPGVKIGDITALDARGVDRKALARKVVQVFCQQIFVDGIYHADPHPGNMLVGDDGALVLLDFGAVAELSPQMREGIPEFLEGVIRRDTDQLIKAMRKMGFLSRTDSPDVSEKVIEFFHQRFQDEVKIDTFNLKDIKLDPQKGIESLVDLRKMNIGLKELSGAFHIPRDWVLLERTILLLTGLCTQLDPELSPMEVIRPYLQDFVLGNRDWAQIAVDAAKDMALKAITIPEDLRKYLNRANRGEFELRVKGLPSAARLVYAGIRQLIYAAIGIASGFAALQLHLAGQAHLARYCLYGAAAAGVLLLGSLLLTRTK
ncbi:ABC1 kinase family protein [Polyangium fumosum]|uniref:AarF/ABC1/UbiB kinase family protein n=1 Tax=Polyangium fumosum TaxID=889272 RepID=A0A4U1J4A5_9BACT|nr:AarF/UbiB family protein [Polyangium fumosum]TKD02054.1 AarF/ABC1/UbiB kinase family protein [Polyangium fumosum]